MTDTAPETKPLPVMSERGDNAYYIDHCDVVEHSPSYAACLSKIKKYAARALNPVHSDCGKAIDNGRCRAAKMQREEREEGVALYYMPRSIVLAAANVIADAGSTKAWEKFGSSKDVAQRKTDREQQAPVEVPVSDSDYSAGLGAAIARVAQQESELKIVEDPVSVDTLQRKPRAKKAVPTAAAPPKESNLELARRMNAAKKLA